MVRVTLRHDVDDYEAWRAVYDERVAAGLPASRGVRDHHVYQDVTNPNNVTIMFDFDDQQTAQEFVMNTENRRVLEAAGVHPDGMLLSIVEDDE